MGRIHFKNEGNAPVHVKLSNAGFEHHHKNFLMPGETVDFDVAAIGWDASAIYATDNNAYQGAADNFGPGVGLASILAGGLVGIGSTVLLFVPGSQPVSVAGIAWAKALVAFGFTAMGLSVAYEIASRVLNPAIVSELYGGYNYSIYVHNNVEGHLEKKNGKDIFIIDKIAPMMLQWRNWTKQIGGEERAPV